MISMEAKMGTQSDFINILLNRINFDIRCSAVGIIKKFDSEKQTVDVQLVTKEKIVIKNKLVSKKIPELGDVPICTPRAGNFIITMPIKVGDECLVIFSDTCFDAWFQSGGEENEQLSGRRHDLSDAIAICGVWNQKKLVDNYSSDSVQIRNLENTQLIEITDNDINIKSTQKINIESQGEINIDSTTNVNVNSNAQVNIESTGNIKIESSGGNVDVKGTNVTIADGLQGVARLGDTVAVDGLTHTGTITSASTKVKAG